MNKFIVFLSLMMVIGAADAQIYKWIDNQGNVHYSDVPHKGATSINIPEEQHTSSPSAPEPQTLSNSPPDEEQGKKQAYTNLAIIQPGSGATIRNNQGFVEVSVEFEPDLYPGDKLQIIYDNVPLGQPQRNPVFEISGMYRGTHTLAAQILDKAGNVLETSEPITIYVFRPRVGMVPGTSNK